MDYSEFSYKIKELFSEYETIPDRNYLVIDIDNKFHLIFWSYSFTLYHLEWRLSNNKLYEYLNNDNRYETTLDEAIIFKELILPKYLI